MINTNKIATCGDSPHRDAPRIARYEIFHSVRMFKYYCIAGTVTGRPFLGRVQLKCDGTRLTHGWGSEGETGEWSG